MRQAISEVCGVPAQQTQRFTVHSLRVGGLNYYKRIGVPIESCADIASHRSIRTSNRYLRMLPYEQLRQLDDKIAR